MMDEQYRCERCRRLATEVHHIKPIQTKDGWELRFDYNNLLAVCVDCHNKEHNRFQRKKVIKLKQIVCDGTTLNLIKEKKVIEFGEVFEVDDEERAKEILAATYKNKPVAELVKETIKDKVVITTDKVPSQVKQGTKKDNKKEAK